MNFKLKFLGTGHAFSRFEDNYHNNAIVSVDDGPKVMIDCGVTAPQALHECKISTNDIAAIAITHLHGDHCGGLEQVIWERYYTGNEKPNFFKTDILTHTNMREYVIDYLEPVLNPYTHADGTIKNVWQDNLVNVISNKINSFKIANMHVSFRETKHVCGNGHNKPAYGITLESNGRFAYFSGDTTFDSNFIKQIAKKMNIIFHECSFSKYYPQTVHTHYEKLMTLPVEIRQKIVLMHFGTVPANVNPSDHGFRVANRFDEFQI